MATELPENTHMTIEVHAMPPVPVAVVYTALENAIRQYLPQAAEVQVNIRLPLESVRRTAQALEFISTLPGLHSARQVLDFQTSFEGPRRVVNWTTYNTDLDNTAALLTRITNFKVALQRTSPHTQKILTRVILQAAYLHSGYKVKNLRDLKFDIYNTSSGRWTTRRVLGRKQVLPKRRLEQGPVNNATRVPQLLRRRGLPQQNITGTFYGLIPPGRSAAQKRARGGTVHPTAVIPPRVRTIIQKTRSQNPRMNSSARRLQTLQSIFYKSKIFLPAVGYLREQKKLSCHLCFTSNSTSHSAH